MVKLKIVLLLLVIALCSSCNAATTTNIFGCTTYWESTSFPVRVSPDNTFDEFDSAILQVAVDRWNDVVGAEVFIIVPNVLLEDHTLEGIEISRKELPHPLVGYCPTVPYNTLEGRLGRIWRAGCLIDRSRIRSSDIYVRTVIHELGHALGLRHDNHKASVMFPSIFVTASNIMPKHVDTVRKMVNASFKRKTVFSYPSCF